MPNHPFHRKIGDLFKNDDNLKDLGLTQDNIWFDPACDRSRKKRFVTLFYGTGQGRVRFCLVDILILAHDKVVVIEIEESNVKPLHLFGKFYATAYSTHFKDQDISKIPLLFIQVLLEPRRTRKGKQWERVEKVLQEQAEKWRGKKIKYGIIRGKRCEFKDLGTRGLELLQSIKSFLRTGL